MLTLARCGREAEALRRAEALRKDTPHRNGTFFDLAFCYAVCAGKTGDPAAKQKLLRKAIEALREATRSGYRDAVALETDPDLDALRGHPDFDALLAGLTK